MFILVFLFNAKGADWCHSKDEKIAHTVKVLTEVTDSKNCDQAFRRLYRRRTLDLSNQNIETIEPLKEANLSVLLLCNNRITEIASLSAQSELFWLDLSYNPLVDLQVISELKEIDTLLLEGVWLSSKQLQPNILCQYSIQYLSLRGSGIEDVQGLQNCKQLQFLGLAGNRISDLRPLSSLKKIRSLDLEGNPIQHCPEKGSRVLNDKCNAALLREK